MTLKTLQRYRPTSNTSALRGGEGPSLVLIHGVGLNAQAWGPMVEHLLPHFSLTLPDMPGHGESAAFEKKPSLADYSTEMLAALNTIDGPHFIAGHSMGALLAMELASLAPEKVGGMAAMNAIYRRTPRAKAAVEKRAQDIRNAGTPDPRGTLERWFGALPSDGLQTFADDCRNWLTTVDALSYGHAYSVFAREDGPSVETLSNIKCPSLFITGAEEPNSTPAMSEALAQEVKRGEAIIVDGAKHMMPMTHAEVVSQHLINFYKRVVQADE